MPKAVPAKKRPGRPPVAETERKRKLCMRFTDAQIAKIKLGGPQWLRDAVDNTPLPKQAKPLA